MPFSRLNSINTSTIPNLVSKTIPTLSGTIGRRDSMTLTFHVPPLASRQGLCDIDRVWLGVTQKNP